MVSLNEESLTHCRRTKFLNWHGKPSSSLVTLIKSSSNTAYASVGTFFQTGRSSSPRQPRPPQATQRTSFLQSPSENSPSKWIQAQPSPPYSGWPQYSKQTSFQNFLAKSLRPISAYYIFQVRVCVCHGRQKKLQALPGFLRFWGKVTLK